jgi:chromosome segregation ATPase
MWRFAVPVAVLAVVGCANPRPSADAPAGSSPQPATRAARGGGHVQDLREARDAQAARVREIEASLRAFEDANPSLDQVRAATSQGLIQISNALVKARIEEVEVQFKYAAGHPAAQAAAKQEQELAALYRQSMEKMNELDRLALERDRLTDALRDAREELRRLDDRIARLEDRA